MAGFQGPYLDAAAFEDANCFGGQQRIDHAPHRCHIRQHRAAHSDKDKQDSGNSDEEDNNPLNIAHTQKEDPRRETIQLGRNCDRFRGPQLQEEAKSYPRQLEQHADASAGNC